MKCQFLIGKVQPYDEKKIIQYAYNVSIPHRQGTTQRQFMNLLMKRNMYLCQFLIGKVQHKEMTLVGLPKESVNSS